MRQGDKVGTLKVTKPTSPTLAGEIRSTSEDTSGWSTDASGNKIDNGRLALSTSTSTTLTACETLYPDLWAKAPTGWRSGSNLIVPAQGGFVSEVASGTLTTVDTGYTIDTAVDDWIAVREGNQVTLWFALKFDWSSPADTSPDFDLGLPSSMIPTKEVTSTVVRNDGAWDEGVVTLNIANQLSVYRNANFGGFAGSGTYSTGHPSWDYGVTMTYQVSGVASNGDTTPYIQAYNNIAANSLGLPAATATQAGTVKKNKWQKKYLTADVTTTTADVTSLKFNNLVIGKMYRARLQMNCDLPNDSGTDSCRLTLNNNGVEICRAYVYKNGVADETHALTISAEGVFEATTTTMIASATISGTGVIRFTSSLTNVILEELNNYDTETTDFT